MQKLLKDMGRCLFETKKFSKSTSPDYEWLKFTIDKLDKENTSLPFILRPTRNHKTILRAWRELRKNKSRVIAGVQISKSHPVKCGSSR